MGSVCRQLIASLSIGKLPVQVDMSRISNLEESEHAPPVPPKKINKNDTSSLFKGKIFKSHVEPKEVPVPALPPKQNFTFVSER